jgi:hypothetical protein
MDYYNAVQQRMGTNQQRSYHRQRIEIGGRL